MPTIRGGLDAIYRRFAALETVDLVTRLILIVLLLSSWVAGDQWFFKTPLRLLAIAGLLVPSFHRSRALWVGIAVLFSLKTVSNWWIQDNHLFLLNYFTLALALALWLEKPLPALAFNGKILLGVCFLFATLWKGVLSPDFIDGAYFHYTFLTDPRFAEVGLILAKMQPGFYGYNQTQLLELADPLKNVSVATLQGTPLLAVVAKLATAWTLVIEAILAVTFLAPRGTRLAHTRHAFLLLFGWTTYLVVTIQTFGWTLMILGLAQCEPDRERTRFLYALTFCLLLVYDYVPVLTLLR